MATGVPQRGTEGISMPMKSSGSKANREEHTSLDSLSSTDSLNLRLAGEKTRDSVTLGINKWFGLL